MSAAIRIGLPLSAIHAYCERQPIRRLSLFGSALREDFSGESDVDFLVEYLPGVPVTLLDMAQQEIDLGVLIGRKADLRTPAELSGYFRQAVVDSAVVIYERD